MLLRLHDLGFEYLADFYKFGHQHQYADDIDRIWVDWTPRSTRIQGCTKIVNFGNTLTIKAVLMDIMQQNFFGRKWESVRDDYRYFTRNTLMADLPVDHVKAVHDLGYLPIRVYTVPEGTRVPLNIPTTVITNTVRGYNYRWLPNYLESVWSNMAWKMLSAATRARRYREIFTYWARQAGEKDLGFIDWQGHDFSYRGMSGTDDAVFGGLGHLLFFRGTDTAPAIIAAQRYYNGSIENMGIGGSVNATEHSVMCAGLPTGELETIKRLLTEVYPSGVLSVVSDTWDLWQVLTQHLPMLKDVLEVRDGKLVIRPDSGNPECIICGDPAYASAHGSPQALGVLRLLQQVMGHTERPGMLPLLGKLHPIFLNTVASIYGDAITENVANEILRRTVTELKLSPFNNVFGIGSFTYEYMTRDTFGLAMKAIAAQRNNGEIYPMFKKPVTDSGTKHSHKGIPAVYIDGLDEGGEPIYRLKQEATEYELNNCAYQVAFDDGELLIDPKLDDLRNVARTGI